ncbi:hypothetical protein SLEP1_g4353 [Rubroshorea leprosula]|uniref:Uncharacterized protein n=1 Tax=Rubroshorea leprosula TaxID=152421 RepID=A0AAV5HWK4_9ROSI|nr:hypothetical protein SLEP1_g4353 [Rubroshorea leprosula]
MLLKFRSRFCSVSFGQFYLHSCCVVDGIRAFNSC